MPATIVNILDSVLGKASDTVTYPGLRQFFSNDATLTDVALDRADECDIKEEDYSKRFSVTAGLRELTIPGSERDLDAPDRKIWRRVGTRQLVFDVTVVAIVLGRKDRDGNFSDVDYDKFWKIITRTMTWVNDQYSFGPGTRPASAIYSEDLPQEEALPNAVCQRYIHFVIPAYFERSSEIMPVYSDVGTVPPTELVARFGIKLPDRSYMTPKKILHPDA